MSYSIKVSVVNDTNDKLTLVEKTVWYYANGGTWADINNGYILSMAGSGTSGVLRFQSSNGEQIALVTGVHNYKRWCDIAVDIQDAGVDKSTAMFIHPTYYQPGPNATTREKQLSDVIKTTAKGKRVTVHFYVNEGNNLYATLTYT
jgi:hypothetical protein